MKFSKVTTPLRPSCVCNIQWYRPFSRIPLYSLLFVQNFASISLGGDCKSHDNLKTKLMQNFGEKTKSITTNGVFLVLTGCYSFAILDSLRSWRDKEAKAVVFRRQSPVRIGGSPGHNNPASYAGEISDYTVLSLYFNPAKRTIFKGL